MDPSLQYRQRNPRDRQRQRLADMAYRGLWQRHLARADAALGGAACGSGVFDPRGPFVAAALNLAPSHRRLFPEASLGLTRAFGIDVGSQIQIPNPPPNPSDDHES